MNKIEFLQKLKEDLSSLSDEERTNALKYYEEYFADAGEEKEETIAESVSPEDLANKIQEEIAALENKEPAANPEESEKNDENIFREEIPEKEEIPEEIVIQIKKEEKNEEDEADEENEEETVQTDGQYQKNIYNSSQTKNNNAGNNNTLKIILIICTIPIWGPFAITLASVAFGLAMGFFGIAIGVASIALSGFVMIGAGAFLVGTGVFYLFVDAFSGFTSLGAGFLVVGLGIFMAYGFTKLTKLMFKSQFKFVKWTITGIANKFSRQGA